MPFIEIEQANFFYQDIGHGEVLLFVHGFPLDHSMWQHQIEFFSRDYRVICPDLPGFGRSGWSGSSMSISELADGLATLLDRLEIGRVVFCGLSMGGYLGWQFWNRHHLRLNGLIACNTRAAADSETVARGRRLSASQSRQQGSGNLANEMVPKLFATPFVQANASAVELIRDVINHANPEMVAQAQLAMADRVDATDWLPKIKTPMLFVSGEFDTITTVTEMNANAALVAGADCVEIPRAAHLTPLENPLAFNQAVQKFLNSTLGNTTEKT